MECARYPCCLPHFLLSSARRSVVLVDLLWHIWRCSWSRVQLTTPVMDQLRPKFDCLFIGFDFNCSYVHSLIHHTPKNRPRGRPPRAFGSAELMSLDRESSRLWWKLPRPISVPRCPQRPMRMEEMPTWSMPPPLAKLAMAMAMEPLIRIFHPVPS